MNPEIAAVSVDNLVRTFPNSTTGDILLFNGLSFEVSQGDFVALTGATGCGKTTLLNIICGLDKPTGGSVTVFGKNIAALSDDGVTDLRAQKIGIVFQTSGLMPSLSVAQNIEVPLLLRKVPQQERDEKSREVMEFFGLTKKSNSSILSLSVGERRKTAIARAVITKPDLLLLDEPTAGLDTPTSNILSPLLRGMHFLQSRTIVIATNSLEIARIASKEVPVERPIIVTSQKEE